MKITHTVPLENDATAYALEFKPSDKEQAEFYAWAGECGLMDYVTLHNYRKPTVRGVQYLPAILVEKSAPDHLKTLLLLRWE
jgi:hypothetical protein